MWRATATACRQAVAQTNIDMINVMDEINTPVTKLEDGSHRSMMEKGNLFAFKTDRLKWRTCLSLEISTPSIATMIEARRANIKRRAAQIIEFKQ